MAQIGRFQIREKLGAGNQGTVYLCYDPELQRNVAIKLLDRAELQNGQAENDFRHEARMMSRLQHPNIVALYEVGQRLARPYLVCEYVQGMLLSEWLAQDRPSFQGALDIFEGILEGISQAHGLGVVHRDLKPSNIIISGGQVPKIMDFGISRVLSTRKTHDSQLIGTPRYLAPEYIQSGEVGTQADVFALGVILYEMLSGRVPFKGSSRQELLSNIVHGDVRPPSTLNAAVDERLDVIVLKGIEKESDARFESAGEMLEALKAYRQSHAGERFEGGEGSEGKGTIEFLLRRMRHHSDFPALAHSVTTLNRLVASEHTSTSALASVIIKDFALTSKILKVVNSAYYSRFSGKIGTISRAIVVLGVKAIRSIGASLIFFEHLHDRSHAMQLKDQVSAALFSALLARQTAEAFDTVSSEESFLCGMMHNLGKILVTYYLHEESREIERLITQEGMNEHRAQRTVLGVDFQEVGIAVAKQWNFPLTITRSMSVLGAEEIEKPRTVEKTLQVIANFSNEVAAVLSVRQDGDNKPLENLLKRYHDSITFDTKKLDSLVTQATKELVDLTKAFKARSGQSDFISRLSEEEKISPPQHQADNGTVKVEIGVNGIQKHVVENTFEIGDELTPDAETILTDGIQEVTNIILEHYTLTQVFNVILETMYRGMRFNRVLLCLQDVNTRWMVARLGFGADIPVYTKKFRFPGQYSADVFHAALKNGVDIYIEDASDQNIQNDLPGWYKEISNAASFIIFPLLVSNRSVGLIYADFPTARGLAFTAKQLNLLKALRNQAVLALRQKM
jgi:serine/threonine protein kinase